VDGGGNGGTDNHRSITTTHGLPMACPWPAHGLPVQRLCAPMPPAALPFCSGDPTGGRPGRRMPSARQRLSDQSMALSLLFYKPKPPVPQQGSSDRSRLRSAGGGWNCRLPYRYLGRLNQQDQKAANVEELSSRFDRDRAWSKK
jgi:hypothetical protein